MKKALLALLLTAALCLPGCGSAIQRGVESLPEEAQEALAGAVRSWSDSRWSLQDPIDEFFAAVDARDAAAVRAMFSPNAQAEDETLEEDIQRLFSLYPGPTEECEMLTPPGASKHIGWRSNSTTVHNTFPVVCQGVNYWCAFSYTTKDQSDAGNVGLNALVFMTEKVKANDEFLQTLEAGAGLTVAEDCPGDYETRRIGDMPYIFTPIERTITREEIAEFLEAGSLWDAFAARFGPPNAEGWLHTGVWYELAPEDGQARYARLTLQDSGGGRRIVSAYLYNGHDHQELNAIWTSQEAENEGGAYAD